MGETLQGVLQTAGAVVIVAVAVAAIVMIEGRVRGRSRTRPATCRARGRSVRGRSGPRSSYLAAGGRCHAADRRDDVPGPA
ncbi:MULTISPECIES: hypothetical protein [Thermomonosporaceae]|uniref:hypothetical protein n=1 Tax=Thermomonosporaceae TaxID=2012 RepID=UPI00255AA967|nr:MULTISPECIES: hypothetical protein [Thermomonosporaceae]MDL4775475.1 hypothetical protein [Actinomadura xylanilytica]